MAKTYSAADRDAAGAWLDELASRRAVKPALEIDGDARETVRRAREAARDAGWTAAEWEEFAGKALVGDYADPRSADCLNFVVVTTEYFACVVP